MQSQCVIKVVAVVGEDTFNILKNTAGLYFANTPLDVDIPLSWGFTDSVEKAKKFDFESAYAFYTQTSKCRPIRPDGKPNKPLTVFTVAIQPIGDS